MIELLRLHLVGEPKAVQSVKVRVIGGHAQTYQPKQVIDWKNYIRMVASSQLPPDWKIVDFPIGVKCEYVFSPLKSMPKRVIQALQDGKIIYKPTKPDLGDNLFKGLADSLTGVVWKDDAVICETFAVKRYGLSPYIDITVYALN